MPDYSSYTSSVGFWGGIFGGIGDFFPPNVPLPTRPNPQSQVMIAQNAVKLADASSPLGYSYGDLWYDPISSRPGSIQSIQGYEPVVTRDPYTGRATTTQRPIYGPRFYYVKSQSQEQRDIFDKVDDSLFRAPESAVINTGPCDTPSTNTAATARERINRLIMNQFLSPFRARRAGGNSYQALSEPMDALFKTNGEPGDFAKEELPAIVQSRPGWRTRR